MNDHAERSSREFGNGDQFYAKAGELIELPTRKVDRPHRDLLQRHWDRVFESS